MYPLKGTWKDGENIRKTGLGYNPYWPPRLKVRQDTQLVLPIMIDNSYIFWLRFT